MSAGDHGVWQAESPTEVPLVAVTNRLNEGEPKCTGARPSGAPSNKKRPGPSTSAAVYRTGVAKACPTAPAHEENHSASCDSQALPLRTVSDC